MAAITNAGIGSGIDLEAIITAFVDAESIPTEIRLQERQDRLTTELSGVSQFRSALSQFEDVLADLTDPDAFNQQSINASSSDISVDTNGLASNGSFDVAVQQLALGSRVETNPTSFAAATDTVGSGTLTFNAGVNSFDVDIDATDSLSAIRDKINESADNFGVVANILTTDEGTFLSYTSDITGSANTLSVSTSDAVLDDISTNTTVEQAAQDAIITVNGNTVTQDTNVFQNTIEDVTITANAVSDVDSPTTLSISQDEDNGEQLINNFINGYNSLVNTLSTLSNAENGALAFDSSIRQLRSQFSNILNDTVSGVSTSLDSLFDLGLTVNRQGELEISTDSLGDASSGQVLLDDALAANLSGIAELFSADNGIGTQFSELIDSYNNDSDGSLNLRQDSLNEGFDDIEDELISLQERLESFESTLRSRFTSLDSTIAGFTATGDFLLSALAVNNDS